MQTHEAVHPASLEQRDHFIAAKGAVADGDVALLEVAAQLVKAADVMLAVVAGDEVAERAACQIQHADDAHHREPAAFGLAGGLGKLGLVLGGVHELDAGAVNGLEPMPVPELVAFDARLGEGFHTLVNLVEEAVRQALAGLAIAGGVEGWGRQAVGLVPGLDEGEGFGAGLVLLKDLGEPRPEDGDARKEPLAKVRRSLGEPVGGKDVVEEPAKIGDGGGQCLVAFGAENLQLTALLPPLKFRRETRQERGKFFHTRLNPECRVFHAHFRRPTALIPCHS